MDAGGGGEGGGGGEMKWARAHQVLRAGELGDAGLAAVVGGADGEHAAGAALRGHLPLEPAPQLLQGLLVVQRPHQLLHLQLLLWRGGDAALVVGLPPSQGAPHHQATHVTTHPGHCHPILRSLMRVVLSIESWQSDGTQLVMQHAWHQDAVLVVGPPESGSHQQWWD